MNSILDMAGYTVTRKRNDWLMARLVHKKQRTGKGWVKLIKIARELEKGKLPEAEERQWFVDAVWKITREDEKPKVAFELDEKRGARGLTGLQLDEKFVIVGKVEDARSEGKTLDEAYRLVSDELGYAEESDSVRNTYEKYHGKYHDMKDSLERSIDPEGKFLHRWKRIYQKLKTQ